MGGVVSGTVVDLDEYKSERIAAMLPPEPPGFREGRAIARLRELLWPEGEIDEEWSPDHMDAVGRILVEEGFGPVGGLDGD